MKPIRETIERTGQPYVDEPIYHTLAPNPISRAVKAATGGVVPPSIRMLDGHRRIRLRWVKPDGHGGFVPK